MDHNASYGHTTQYNLNTKRGMWDILAVQAATVVALAPAARGMTPSQCLIVLDWVLRLKEMIAEMAILVIIRIVAGPLFALALLLLVLLPLLLFASPLVRFASLRFGT